VRRSQPVRNVDPTSIRRILHRLRQQVRDDLFESIRIGHHQTHIRAKARRQLVFRRNHFPESVEDSFDHRARLRRAASATTVQERALHYG